VRTQIRSQYKAAANSEIRAAGCQCKVDILLKNVGTEVSVHQNLIYALDLSLKNRA
jgi:hypothetical protein